MEDNEEKVLILKNGSRIIFEPSDDEGEVKGVTNDFLIMYDEEDEDGN